MSRTVREGWAAPAGMHAQLLYDRSCGYYWAKPTGTIYHFYSPSPSATNCPSGSAQTAGYWGRMYSISGAQSHQQPHLDL